MGVLESVAAIATLLVTAWGGFMMWRRSQKNKAAQSYSDKESILETKIQNAASNAEREKYAQELDALRNRRS